MIERRKIFLTPRQMSLRVCELCLELPFLSKATASRALSPDRGWYVQNYHVPANNADKKWNKANARMLADVVVRVINRLQRLHSSNIPEGARFDWQQLNDKVLLFLQNQTGKPTWKRLRPGSGKPARQDKDYVEKAAFRYAKRAFKSAIKAASATNQRAKQSTGMKTRTKMKRSHWRSIEAVKNRLKARQIECLSKEYPGTRAQCQFKCLVCGHEWPSTLNSVLAQATGCPKCGTERGATRRMKKGFKKLEEVLRTQRIVIVSEYKGTREDAEFECQVCHHKWWQTPRMVRCCPKCEPLPAGPRLDNQGYRRLLSRLAKQHIQLASPYRGMVEDNEFECTVCHHKWWQRPSNTKHCPVCDPPPQGPVPGQYPGKKYPRR